MHAHMKIAVTGGSGRIGSEVARQMRERGHDVLSLDIRPPADTTLPHRVVDLRVASALRKAFDGLDAVCHLGEYPNVYGGAAETFSHNTETGSTVMATAKQVGVPRLIYTSSCQVYGYWGDLDIALQPPPAYLPLDEASLKRGTKGYALGKIANESFAELLTTDGAIDIAAFRFPFVMGQQHAEWAARERLRPRGHFHEGFGTYLIKQDAALAYCLALEIGWKGFEAFHFVAQDTRYAGNLRDRIQALWPSVVMPAGWNGFTPPVDTSKALQWFGWKAALSLTSMFPDLTAEHLAKTA